MIPVDPLSLKPVVRCEADDRFLGDPTLRAQGHRLARRRASWTWRPTTSSSSPAAGARRSTSAPPRSLADKVAEADAAGAVLGGICHGPLGLVHARAADGRPLVEGRRVTGVTDKQVQELGIGSTPFHPETELRRAGARFESATRFRDPLANHWVVDGASSPARTRTPGRWSPGRCSASHPTEAPGGRVASWPVKRLVKLVLVAGVVGAVLVDPEATPGAPERLADGAALAGQPDGRAGRPRARGLGRAHRRRRLPGRLPGQGEAEQQDLPRARRRALRAHRAGPLLRVAGGRRGRWAAGLQALKPRLQLGAEPLDVRWVEHRPVVPRDLDGEDLP